MIENRSDYLYQPEKGAQTHGVVIFLVNSKGEVLYGYSPIETKRSKKGEKKLISEAREGQERISETINRCLEQELKGHADKVDVPKIGNLRHFWLGSVKYMDDTNAQVFCLRWTGSDDEIPIRSEDNHDLMANDFIAEAWINLAELPTLDMGQGPKNVVTLVLNNPEVMIRIREIGQGVRQ